jgi:hypothetical protein
MYLFEALNQNQISAINPLGARKDGGEERARKKQRLEILTHMRRNRTLLCDAEPRVFSVYFCSQCLGRQGRHLGNLKTVNIEIGTWRSSNVHLSGYLPSTVT